MSRWLTHGILAFLSIFSAVVITMIGVGIERPGYDEFQLTRKTSFVNGFTAVTNIVFAYCEFSRMFFMQQVTNMCAQVVIPPSLVSSRR